SITAASTCCEKSSARPSERRCKVARLSVNVSTVILLMSVHRNILPARQLAAAPQERPSQRLAPKPPDGPSADQADTRDLDSAWRTDPAAAKVQSERHRIIRMFSAPKPDQFGQQLEHHLVQNSGPAVPAAARTARPGCAQQRKSTRHLTRRRPNHRPDT